MLMVHLDHLTPAIRSMACAILHLDAKINMQETTAAYAIVIWIIMEFSLIAKVGKLFIFQKNDLIFISVPIFFS